MTGKTTGDPTGDIADALGKVFYAAEERSDPGTHDVDWEGLDGFTKALYVEGVYAVLRHRDLVERFYEVTDGNGVLGRGVTAE